MKQSTETAHSDGLTKRLNALLQRGVTPTNNTNLL